MSKERTINTEEPLIFENENEVSLLKKQIEENKEKFLRIIADYENRMKRVQIDTQNASKSVISNLVKDLVPILEDITNASKIASNETKEGLTLISKNTKKIFKKYGVEEIIPKIGDDFNPEEHQAITSKKSDLGEGKIVEIVKIGYKYEDRTIIPTMVITSV